MRKPNFRFDDYLKSLKELAWQAQLAVVILAGLVVLLVALLVGFSLVQMATAMPNFWFTVANSVVSFIVGRLSK